MVQQIRDRDVEGGRLPLYTAIDYGGKQVGLTGASRSGKEQPALWAIGVFNGGLVRLREPLLSLQFGGASIGVHGVEPELGEGSQVAVELEPFHPLSLGDLFLAGTGNSPAKVRMTNG